MKSLGLGNFFLRWSIRWAKDDPILNECLSDRVFRDSKLLADFA